MRGPSKTVLFTKLALFTLLPCIRRSTVNGRISDPSFPFVNIDRHHREKDKSVRAALLDRSLPNMITLLTSVVLTEGGIALLLMIHFTPFRKLLMKGLDILKTGKGSAVVKTLGGTMGILLAATISSIIKIERRVSKFGSSTPTDQYLLRTYLLEASLIGYALFLGLVINRLHHYLRELITAKVSLETLKKQAKAAETEYLRLKAENASSQEKADGNSAASEEIGSLKDVITGLRQKVEEVQSDVVAKDKAAKAAEANASALQKQSEGFLLEYDRLLEDNQHLRSQLASLDRRHSQSDNKKNL